MTRKARWGATKSDIVFTPLGYFLVASSPVADFGGGRLQRIHKVSASTGVPVGTTEFDKLYVEINLTDIRYVEGKTNWRLPVAC